MADTPQQVLDRQRGLLSAYVAFGASAYGQVILADLIEGTCLRASPSLDELLALPHGVTHEALTADVWMREGERRLVLKLRKAIAEAPATLDALERTVYGTR